MGGGKGEGFSGTTTKYTWTKTRHCGITGGRWGLLGLQGEMGKKGGKL